MTYGQTFASGASGALLRAGDVTRGFRAAARRLIVLDYDGTLVPLQPDPERCAPAPEVVAQLERLAALERTRVAVVSGRLSPSSHSSTPSPRNSHDPSLGTSSPANGAVTSTPAGASIVAPSAIVAEGVERSGSALVSRASPYRVAA